MVYAREPLQGIVKKSTRDECMEYNSEERRRLQVCRGRGKEMAGSVTKLESSNESGIRTCNQGFGGAAHVRQQQHGSKQTVREGANVRRGAAVGDA